MVVLEDTFITVYSVSGFAFKFYEVRIYVVAFLKKIHNSIRTITFTGKYLTISVYHSIQ